MRLICLFQVLERERRLYGVTVYKEALEGEQKCFKTQNERKKREEWVYPRDLLKITVSYRGAKRYSTSVLRTAPYSVVRKCTPYKVRSIPHKRNGTNMRKMPLKGNGQGKIGLRQHGR